VSDEDDGLVRKRSGRTVMGGTVHPLVYGPVDSRRYGRSLGVNLLPPDVKHCNFDCGYCQLGRTHLDTMRATPLPSREQVREAVGDRMCELAGGGEALARITLSGNGEPTLHPEFPEIVDDVLALRDRWFPGVPVGVLSNASTAHAAATRAALLRLDDCVMKLDAGREETLRAVDVPLFGFDLERIVSALQTLPRVTVQALFHRGPVDNTSDEEVSAWIGLLRRVRPAEVQIYTLDRDPADPRLLPCPGGRLEEIARLAEEATGVPCRAWLPE
jgi:wyosine [tRNA(Phe)-imidazoG37] synthetase (radical SAM superfamily)